LTSVITTWRAPTKRAMATAMMPIGPAPVISTSSPTRLKDSAVGGVAQRVEDRGDLVGDRRRQLEHVRGRQRHVLGEAPGAVDADADRVAAQVAASGAAVAAVAAGDVALAGDAVAGREPRHLAAHLDDLAAVLVADLHRHRDGALRPGVPVVDVDVGAADRGLPHADEDVVRADARRVHVLHPDARLAASALTRAFMGPHGMMPSSRPAVANAAMARSSCSSRMAGAHLGADARLAERHDRVGEADHVHAEFEEAVGHAHGERGFAEHDRDDRMLAGHEVEAERREPARKCAALSCSRWRSSGMESSRSSTRSVVAATTGAIEFENR
jgi:hypothetical protein